jgi:hypothetical protein
MGAIGNCCCGTCSSCCIRRIEISIGKEDEVYGDPPKVPLGEIAWDIDPDDQPETEIWSDVMPDGKTQQVCIRQYNAPISETICVGTARELPINGIFRTLDRDLALAGRYGLFVADDRDFTGTLHIRCNIIVSGLLVRVLWSSGWIRMIMTGESYEEAFSFPNPGATMRRYDTITCASVGGTTTYVDDVLSVFCDPAVGLDVCPSSNPYIPGMINPGYHNLPNFPAMDTGWLASSACEDEDYTSNLYGLMEYYTYFCPGAIGPGQLPLTRTVSSAYGTSCSQNDFSQTFRDLEDTYTYRRNRVKLFVC